MENKEIVFSYKFECVRCGLIFMFEYKNELVGTASCPICEQQRLFPKEINKIEKIINDNLIGSAT